MKGAMRLRYASPLFYYFLLFHFSKNCGSNFGREKALGCEKGRRLKLGGCYVVLVTYGARLRQLGK